MTSKNLVLAGKPGSGKTTLIREAVLPYKDRIGGFFTEAILESGMRMGFLLRTFDGKEGVLAHKGLASPVRLNKYGIALGVLEGIGIFSLRQALRDRRLLVLDEIGSMEMFSEPFRRVVMECLGGPLPVLATIRLGSQPFSDAIKKMEHTRLLTLARENYDSVKKQVRDWLAEAIQGVGEARE